MPFNIFELFGKISISSSNAKEEIDDITASAKDLATQLGATDTKAGKSVGKGSKLDAGAVWLGTTASKITSVVGRAVSKLPGMMVESAAEVNAKTAAFNSTFGELADSASALYKAIGEEANILETRLRSVGTKGFSQLKGAGLSASDALTESERMLRLAADAAAYYDISLETADERIRSFMRVNVEAGDAIGLFTSAGQRDAAAIEAYGQEFKDLTEAQKQLLLLNIADSIYKTNGVFGQASRESMEYANVTANATEASTVSLATFGTQINNSLLPALHNLTNWLMDETTQQKLNVFADALGKIAAVTFDKATSFFEWMVDNGGTVKAILWGVAAAFLATAAAAHPYITALATIIGYIETVKGLQKDIDKFENKYNLPEPTLDNALKSQNKKTGRDLLEGLYLGNRSVEINAELKEGAENDLQNDLDAQDLSVDVKVNPIMNWLGNLFGGKQSFTSTSSSGTTHTGGFGDGFGANGSHASGLDRVPFDGYRAILHRDEAVLTANEAKLWRGDQNQNDRLATMVAAAVRDAVAGIQFNVSLDSGVLVGNLAPVIDRQLGSIASRKGRG